MADQGEQKRVRRCPICKAAAEAAFMPFCSKRCADVDLGKWFTDAYVVPGAADDDEDARGGPDLRDVPPGS